VSRSPLATMLFTYPIYPLIHVLTNISRGILP
jgi:hypothetical protein